MMTKTALGLSMRRMLTTRTYRKTRPLSVCEDLASSDGGETEKSVVWRRLRTLTITPPSRLSAKISGLFCVLTACFFVVDPIIIISNGNVMKTLWEKSKKVQFKLYVWSVCEVLI